MKTIKTTVYSFNELSDKAKKKALENLYDINVDADWGLFLYDDFYSALSIIGVSTGENSIRSSGFASQGDGLSFTGLYSYSRGALERISDEVGLCDFLDITPEVKSLEAIQKKNDYKLEGRIERISHAYCHENTVRYYSDADADTDDELTAIFRAIMVKFYRVLEREHGHLTSDESIEATIEANDYYFTDNGKLV